MSRHGAGPAVLVAVLLASGCWIDPDPPGDTGSTCNANGICDDAETCSSCLSDCAQYCCAARHAVPGPSGQIQDPNAALGQPDGKSATLGDGSSLELWMEGKVDDQSGSDLELRGTVAAGTFLVRILDPGRGTWRQVAEWNAGSASPFPVDINLATPTGATIDTIRLESLSGARGSLDAAIALHCQR